MLIATTAAPTQAASLPMAVRGKAIGRSRHTLPRDHRIPGARVGVRTFPTGDGFGVGLATQDGASYPVASTDGGQIWRTDGPALVQDVAQAPLQVTTVSAVSPEVQYAYGAGNVVDVTSDGGRIWRRSLFDGIPMAVVPGYHGNLVALVDMTPRGDGGPTWQYYSNNGGRSWHYTTAAGGGA